VLRPDGRFIVSDIVLTGPLPDHLRASAAAWAGCLAGAVSRERYLDLIRAAGFVDMEIIDESPFPLSCMANDPTAQAVFGDSAMTDDEVRAAEAAIASLKVRAVRPEKIGGD